MSSWWPIVSLVVIVALILAAEHQTALHRLFKWLPIPLWCYALPMLGVTFGWLPGAHPAYRTLTELLLPFALALLLLGVDFPAVIRSGKRALLAAILGAVGVVAGAAFSVWGLHTQLSAEAWKGAGALAGTWTGGTMNLLALRLILEMPDTIFAPLVVVDALFAYSWMALLVAASGFQRPINEWLRAIETVPPSARNLASQQSLSQAGNVVVCGVVAVGLAVGSRMLGSHLPISHFISSATGWTVLLVTTAALSCSLIPSVRRFGSQGARLGYPSLYLVLAATGAQGSFEALRQAPVWFLVGFGVVISHGLLLLAAGRFWRIPLGILATASQANIGGLVSAPLVGAVYEQSLAPVGLLLAMAGNALGTYLGWSAAVICRWLLQP